MIYRRCLVFLVAFIALTTGAISSSANFTRTIPYSVKGSDKRHIVSGSCGEITAKSASTAMTDVKQLSKLISQYFLYCSDKLSIAMNDIYTREARDEIWASGVESKIGLVASEMNEKLEFSGECHQSICIIDLKSTEKRELLGSSLSFSHKVMAALEDTEFSVGGYSIQHQKGIRVYFYSTVLPAPFVKPFLDRMKE